MRFQPTACSRQSDRRELQDSKVRPHAHGTQTDVQVTEADREAAAPGPDHVLPVQTAHTGVCGEAQRRPRNLIDAAADDVTHRMAAEEISGEEGDVGCEEQTADAD